MDLYQEEQEQANTSTDRRFMGRLAGGVEEPHLKDYIRVLLMRRWVVIGISLLVIFTTALIVFLMTPIYQATCLLLIEPTKRKERMLDAIARCTDQKLRLRSTVRIPKDVQRTEIFGTDVWVSSVERGMIDSIVFEECSYYPIFLLLVQNIVNNSVDIRKVMEYADELNAAGTFGSAISIISDRLTDVDSPIEFKGDQDSEVTRSVNLALNTVLG